MTSRKITICLFYRPPVQTRENDDKPYEQLAEISCQIESIIFGNLNLPVFVQNWVFLLHYTPAMSSFHQHVEHPTPGNNILYGITENLSKWIGDRLSERKQQAVINGKH